MAWRPDGIVQCGELDNTQMGRTIGWLQLDGIAERLKLKLLGNCHPDLAGWKFRIYRVEPELPETEEYDEDDTPPDYTTLNLDQFGHVGDITADQMIKHYNMGSDELIRRLHAGENPPFTWSKCLYLEWFSHSNGRVVIQSTRLAVERLGNRAFELTEAQWQEQARRNAEEMDYFMEQLSDAFEARKHDEEA